MSYSLKIERHKVEKLKENAWRVMGGPKRVITDDELASLLCVSASTLSRVKAGGKVPSSMVGAIVFLFRAHPDILDDLWYVEEPKLEAAA